MSIETVRRIYDAFARGDHVVQQGRTKGTVGHSGTAFDIAECHVWTLRDDVVVNADFYIDSQAMLRAIEQ